MDVPTALLRDLLDLGVAGVEGDAELGPRLTALVTALRAAVSSYCGLDLTVHDVIHPVSLTSFPPTADGEEIATSLRLALVALSSGFDSQSRVIFYATVPGAFVDLAADLGHALRLPTLLPGDRTAHPGGGGNGTAGLIVLDADLPPPASVSRLSGLHEMSTINRAVGMLIDQGHHPDDAHTLLRQHAAAAGVDTHIYAARLLRR